MLSRQKKGKFQTIVALVVTLLMIVSLAVPSAKTYAATTKSYHFGDMKYKSAWGTYYSNQNNSGQFTYDGKYKEIQFTLPQTIDMSDCSAVTFNASSPNGKIAFKLYDTAGKQVAVQYNFNARSSSDCTFSPNTNAKVSSIGIMSQEDYRLSATVNNVRFTMRDNVPGAPITSATLLNTYGSLLGHSGVAVNYRQLSDPTTLNAIKKHYNSITMENEMKPDALLGSSANLMSAYAARSNGYYIPNDYTEGTVPTLDFNTIDSILKICYNNGLKLRAHCLVWHSQTPDWFFRTNYSPNGTYVSQSVMNARMEMFINTYMNHVYRSGYGSVVYAWDVVNEYLHTSDCGWSRIYGSNLGTRPAYVKSAFQYAYDCLSRLGLTNSVSLFYNDYNTYQIKDNIISLINYINDGRKICNGVGMQSHLDTSYPSVNDYKSSMQAFLNAGLEVQATELDVTNSSESVQADYVYNLLSAIISLKKAGGRITGITWWGLYDSVSWRASKNPLLFSSLTNEKASYRKAIQAYTDAGLTIGNNNPTATPTVTPTPMVTPIAWVTPYPAQISKRHYRSWNFSSWKFKYLNMINSPNTVNDLGLIATASKPMRVQYNPVRVYGDKYRYCLALGGAGNTYYRAIKIPVSGKDKIKLILKSSGYAKRSLMIAESNGNVLGSIRVNRRARIKSFTYTGPAGYIYLYSRYYGINIYKIRVKSYQR